MAEALYIFQNGQEFRFHDLAEDPRIHRPNQPDDQEEMDRIENFSGPLLHNDISPWNIFLKSSEDSHYPIVVLGDLEGCVSTRDQPSNSPTTFGHMSPVSLIPCGGRTLSNWNF